MAAYIIGQINITDPEHYREYTNHTPRLIADHGGRYLVRGGEKTILEGGADARRVVVIEFPDRAAAEAFYHAPDYAGVRAIRLAASEGQLIIVDGFDATTWASVLAESRQHG